MTNAAATYDVVEVMTDDSELLVLSIGFVSASDPLDVLHIVGSKSVAAEQLRRCEEDALYLERTDQSLACTGEVETIVCNAASITVRLSEEGARLLELGKTTCFTFERRPELRAIATDLLTRMKAAGHIEIGIEEVGG